MIYKSNELKRVSSSFFISLLMFLLIIGLRNLQLLHSLEMKAYDLFVEWNAQKYPVDSRIVLIGIDDQDFLEWGWPLNDKRLEIILNEIIKLNPKVIGLDLYRNLPIPSDKGVSDYPDLESLNRLLKANTKIIGIERLPTEDLSAIAAPHGLDSTKPRRVGFNNVSLDEDAIVRRSLLYLYSEKESKPLFSFPYKLFNSFTGKEAQPDPLHSNAIRLGTGSIQAIDSYFQFFLDFQGVHKHFKQYSMTDVLTKQIPPDIIKNKIVIIGITAESEKDYFHTGFKTAKNEKLDLSGIQLIGHMTSQLIRIADGDSDCLKVFSKPVEWLSIFLGSLLGAVTAYLLRHLIILGCGLLLQLLTLCTLSWIVFSAGWWFPLIPTIAAWFLGASGVFVYLTRQEQLEKKFLQRIYSHYLPQNVAEYLWKNRDSLIEGNRIQPHNLTATVLFSDVCRFSDVADQCEPKDLLNWLNPYIQAMLSIVNKHHGMVNKMIGDGVMAVFGAPILKSNPNRISQDAINAATCALELSKEIENINIGFKKNNLPPMKIRIGIMTGPLVAGSIGDKDRVEYTVLGDTVNAAARLESYDKSSDQSSSCRILIGDNMLSQLNDLFITKYVGKVALKGKSKEVGIYQLIARINQA